MITWMQRHKKWLVSTIWVSTIAFVGAGFVGWGSYDFGKSGGAVAVVGDRQITIKEYQNEYSKLYQQYQQIFGDQFNQEMADKLKLKDVAYKLAIEKNLILSYADSLGLDVTDTDIASELANYTAFIKDGKFDKDTYIKVLNRNGTTVGAFEDSLRRDILLKKVESFFKVEATNKEVEELSKLLSLEDNLNVKVLDKNSINISYTNDELKKYWEANKNNYMSESSFELQVASIKLDKKSYDLEKMKRYYNDFKTDFKKTDGKIKTFEEAKADVQKRLDLSASKKSALKAYVKYKKGELKFDKSQVLFTSQLAFGENNQKIMETKEGKVIKPILVNDEYEIVKLVKKIAPKELSFEKAQKSVKADYENSLKDEKLATMAKNELKSFKGKNIGWIGTNAMPAIDGLSQMEVAQFTKNLFDANKKMGQIKLGSKIVLFKINDSRFAKSSVDNKEALKSTLNKLQNNELMTNFVKALEERYEIQSSMDVKE